jgi:hypothetical protein
MNGDRTTGADSWQLGREESGFAPIRPGHSNGAIGDLIALLTAGCCKQQAAVTGGTTAVPLQGVGHQPINPIGQRHQTAEAAF